MRNRPQKERRSSFVLRGAIRTTSIDFQSAVTTPAGDDTYLS
jgi:hypothetical protein